MRVTGMAAARCYPDRGHAVVLKPTPEDFAVIDKLFIAKGRREEKDGGEVYIKYELEVEVRPKTYSQVKALWALIRIIYISMNGEPPTHEESYDLYLDILDMHANRKPNRFTGQLRPVHLSESDVFDAAALITACMGIIIEFCDLEDTLQAEVRDLFWKWADWRGTLQKDPLDYDEEGNLLTVSAWEAKHKVSDASGIGGYLETAHIVSRGANPTAIEDVRNLIRLTAEEHRAQHQYGWPEFLRKYPHLKNRCLLAKQLFGGN